MATVTVALGIKCLGSIVAGTALLAGIDVFHGDFDRSLFHLRKHVLVVAVFTLVAGFLM